MPILAALLHVALNISRDLDGEYNMQIAKGNQPSFTSPTQSANITRVARYVYLNGAEVESLRNIDENPTLEGNVYSETVTLVRSQSYTIIYFADDGSHDLTNFPQIDRIDDKLFFYASFSVNLSGAASKEVNASAPYAFLNFGNNPDTGNTTLALTVNDAPASLNLLTGATSGEASISASGTTETVVLPVLTEAGKTLHTVAVDITSAGKAYHADLPLPIQAEYVTNIFDAGGCSL